MAQCGETRKEIEELSAKVYLVNSENMKNKPLIDQVNKIYLIL
jgi:hypothetical protein